MEMPCSMLEIQMATDTKISLLGRHTMTNMEPFICTWEERISGPMPKAMMVYNASF